MLICFLAVPQQIFAIDFNFFDFGEDDGYQVLSEFEGKRITEPFAGVFFMKWSSLMMDGYSNAKEKTVISLLKELLTINLWNYYFRDLPLDVSFAVAKQAVEVSKLIVSEDVSGILGKIEKETAKVAVNSLKDYFFKNQIKVSFGAMEVKYKTGAGDVDSPFQYIIMYRPIDGEKGKVVARIYSPKEIIPPAGSGSLGMAKGFLNSLEPGQKIPPFIVEISGEMKKGMYGSYNWESIPEIKTVFPENVPDFSLKPKTWQEKYVIDPIKKKIDELFSFAQFFGLQTETIDYIFKEGDSQKIGDEIKDMKKEDDVTEKYPEKKVDENKETKQTVKEIKEETKIEEKKTEEKKEELFIPAPCSKNNQSGGRHYIIFNEIAWMGSKNSANDEWIELKNISGKDIDLKGYTISNKKEKINIIFDSYVLHNGDFVLLERTDDTSVPYKQADVIYQGALSNSDEELYLFDSSCNVEDYVVANPDWPAGNNAEKRTMERMSDFSWSTYDGNGTNNIWGTPKEANSQGMKKEEKKAETKSSSVLTASLSGPISGGGSAPAEVNYCSQSNLSFPTREVVINEVAWMGTGLSSSDEWIELKNLSGEAVNLNNWQLLDQGNQIKVVFSSSDAISPNGFYLLERTNDDSVPNISANKIYTGALSDTNESLRLFNSSCGLVDEVVASPDWPAGDKTQKKTMERGDDMSWHSYYSVSADAVSGLWGTPKSENSVEAGNDQESVPEQNEINSGEDEPAEEEVNIDSPLLITEVQVNGEEGHEYVELFNSSEEEVDLCATEDNCHYLSYYSPNSVWAEPHRNWRFLDGETILPNSYYIIDIFGDSGGDWRVEKSAVEEGGSPYYSDGQIGNIKGSLAIFSGNPKYAGDEEKTNEEKTALAISLKADAVSWSDGETEILVKEGQPFVGAADGKALGRKWFSGEYHDSDNNSEDFQSEIPSPRNHAPRPPDKIQELSAVANPGQKNSVILFWSIPEDEDTLPEDLDYEIYYARNEEIDESDLLNMGDYAAFEMADAENNFKTVLIPDLYYSSNYSFAVKAKDPEGNYSPISDGVSFAIAPAVHQKPAPYYDFRRSSHANFAGPTNEIIGETAVFAKGNDENPNNDDLSSSLVIDENGTVYFQGEIDGVWGIYAYNSNGKKWEYDSPTVFNEPSLGKDGSIYFTDSNSVYCLSPSGKIEWRKNFEKVYTKNIIIDSEDRIYFLASEEPNNVALFAFDGSIKTLIDVVGNLTDVHYSELIIDIGNNIYFSKDNAVFKYTFTGKITEKTFPVEYAQGYSGEYVDWTEQVYIASDGTVLVNVIQGWCCYDINGRLDVLYALDNNLSSVIWSKREYGSVIGLGNGEFYMSMRRPGFWEDMAVDLTNGSIRWTKGPFFPQSSFIVSDTGSNIYFTQNLGVFGYNSASVTEGVPFNILSFNGAEEYCYTPLSIGENVMYISKFHEILAVRY
jgi:hypothetical protein